MAEAETQAEAPVAAGRAGASSLFSPVALIVIGVIMFVEAVLVYLVSQYMGREEITYQGLDQDYVQIDLGTVTREITSDDLGRLREKFTARIALVLNPAYGDLSALRSKVDKRKDLLKDILLREILYRKNPEEFRKPNFIDDLGREIQLRLNQELSGGKDEHDVIARVIFPDIMSRPREQS